jgi:hypothetical protein
MIEQTLYDLHQLAETDAQLASQVTGDPSVRDDVKCRHFALMEELVMYVRRTDPALNARFAQLERQKWVMERGYDRRDELGRLQALAALDTIGDEWQRLVDSVVARFRVPLCTDY